jgi:hypothetical protein
MAEQNIACPVLKLAASEDVLALTSGTQTLVFDISTGKKLASSSSPVSDDRILANAAQLKAKSVRLVATGYAPLKSGEEVVDGEVDVQPVVAFVTEDKILRLVQADTGDVFYQRLVQKARLVRLC